MTWIDAPIVELPAKRCPHPGCDSSKFIHVWSSDNHDGSRSQRQICCRCSRRVIFVVGDFPQAGNEPIWPDRICEP